MTAQLFWIIAFQIAIIGVGYELQAMTLLQRLFSWFWQQLMLALRVPTYPGNVDFLGIGASVDNSSFCKEPGAGVKTLWSGQTWDDAWVEKLKIMDCCWEFWGALDNWHRMSFKLSLKVKVGDFDEGGHQDVEVAAWCRPLSPRLPCAWRHPRSLIILS